MVAIGGVGVRRPALAEAPAFAERYARAAQEMTAHPKLRNAPLPVPGVERAVRRCLKRGSCRTDLLVAEEQGSVVAVAAFQPHHCDLSNRCYDACNLWVDPDRRHHGIGSALIRARQQYSEWTGLQALVSPSNDGAIRFGQLWGLATKSRLLLSREIGGGALAQIRRRMVSSGGGYGPHGRFVTHDGDTYIVRPAAEGELDFVLGSTRQLYRELGVEPLSPEGVRAGVEHAVRLPNRVYGMFYVLTRMERPVGCVRCYSEYSLADDQWICYLRRVYLGPDHRGLGLAAPFLRATIGLFCRRGDWTLRTLLPPSGSGTQDSRLALMRVYEQLGFSHVRPMALLEGRHTADEGA